MRDFPIRSWLPDGAAGLDALAGQPGWQAVPWRRWLSWRSEDASLEGCLSLIEAGLAGQFPADGNERLLSSLRRWRSRYVLFLAWSGGVGDAPRADADLPATDWLPREIVTDFTRWRRQQIADRAALDTNHAWQANPALQAAFTYRGVPLTPSFDYYALPEMLTRRLHAFKEQTHG
jgi:hypothetical protein